MSPSLERRVIHMVMVHGWGTPCVRIASGVTASSRQYQAVAGTPDTLPDVAGTWTPSPIWSVPNLCCISVLVHICLRPHGVGTAASVLHCSSKARSVSGLSYTDGEQPGGGCSLIVAINTRSSAHCQISNVKRRCGNSSAINCCNSSVVNGLRK